MVTAKKRNKNIKKNKFLISPIDNKTKLNHQNIVNNNENDDDFDFNFVKPTTENENNYSQVIRSYPVRTRNRPSFYH